MSIDKTQKRALLKPLKINILDNLMLITNKLNRQAYKLGVGSYYQKYKEFTRLGFEKNIKK